MRRILGENWALPALDGLSRAFFTSGKLVVQQCKKCAHFQHPPEDICHACQSFDLHDFESAGEGRIESVVVAHHPVHPALKEQVPYAISLVSVHDAPGVLIAGNVFGVAPDEIAIGTEVRVAFEEIDDAKTGQHFTIPQWEIAK
jgi:uncharacterized OB-fold protein